MARLLIGALAAAALQAAGCGSHKNVNVGFDTNDARIAANSALNTPQNTGNRLQQAAASAVAGFKETPTPAH